MRNLFALATLCALTVGVEAQTLDDTFSKIGAGLQAAQDSLSSSRSGSQAAKPPAPGSIIVLETDVPAYSNPVMRTEGAAITLNARSPVTFQGVESGLWKVVPRGAKEPVFVTAQAAVASTGNATIKQAMDRISALAKDLDQDPNVRLKGFSFSLSWPPSISVDFEMRESVAKN